MEQKRGYCRKNMLSLVVAQHFCLLVYVGHAAVSELLVSQYLAMVGMKVGLCQTCDFAEP